MTYAVLAFYHINSLEHPQDEVLRWKRELEPMQAKGRIYLSHEGINAQMSVPMEQLEHFEQWLRSVPSYRSIHLKVHQWHEPAFEKLTIKYRKQLVAFDQSVDFNSRAHHTSAEEFKAMIEEHDPNTVILDVRNQYEYEIGHFEGALAPECETFRDYRAFTERFCKEHDPKTTRVLMYCTGGIRCEFFSPYLAEKGFHNLHQLDGGVIEYGLRVGSSHWQGKLFVFDDRMAVPISSDPAPVISHCKYCHSSCDELYNCANVDCNQLFVSCSACLDRYQGCCCQSCTTSQRLRPLAHQNPHKPFRKWHRYAEASQ